MADLTSGGGGGAGAAITAGKASVEVFADDKALKEGLERAQKRVDTFGKQVGTNFGKIAGATKTLGGQFGALASGAGSAGEAVKGMVATALSALGPWGMLAAAVVSVGTALMTMADNSKNAADSLKDVVTNLDEVRKKRLELEAGEKGKRSQETIDFFEQNASPAERAEYAKFDKMLRELPEKYQRIDNLEGLRSALYQEQHALISRPKRIEALEEAIRNFQPGLSPKQSALSYADTIVKRIKERDEKLVETLNAIDAKYDEANMKLRNELASLSQGELLSGPMGIVQTLAEFSNKLREEIGRREREVMQDMIHPSHRDTWQKNLAPGLLFQGLQASIAGMLNRTNRATSMGGYYSSGQTYSNSLGSVEEKQLDALKNIEKGIEVIAGKPVTVYGQ